MRKTFTVATLLSTVIAAAHCTTAQSHGAVSPALSTELAKSHSVFVVPERLHGGRKLPHEVWFVYENGAVYTTMIPKDARVRSIRIGEPQVTISIGTADGPAFSANGSIVTDAKVHESVLKGLESKYPERWSDYGSALRYNVKTGRTLVVKYTPKDS